jgi:hypothetical protein
VAGQPSQIDSAGSGWEMACEATSGAVSFRRSAIKLGKMTCATVISLDAKAPAVFCRPHLEFCAQHDLRSLRKERSWTVYPDMAANRSTVAIVEDDPSYRHALERLLRASGVETYSFASAEDFLGNALPDSHACLFHLRAAPLTLYFNA